MENVKVHVSDHLPENTIVISADVSKRINDGFMLKLKPNTEQPQNPSHSTEGMETESKGNER